MTRWIKIAGNQYWGFWILGLCLFAIQEIPYMIMPFLSLETNPLMEIQNRFMILDVCEKVLGSVCIVVMTFIVERDAKLFSIKSKKEKFYFGIAVAIIVANFIGWGLYFVGYQSLAIIMLFLVVLPPLYYVFIGLWRRNYVLTTIGCMFLITHVSNVWSNLA